MSKNLDDLDRLEDMSAEEKTDLFDYFDQRPWLKTEYEMQTGKPFPKRPSDDDEDDTSGEGGSSEPSVSPDNPARSTLITGMEIVDPNDDPNAGGVDDGSNPPEERYDDMDHAALKAEIDERNRLRGDSQEEPISKAGSSDDLRARLVADDEAQAEAEDEDSEDDSEDDGSNPPPQ